MKKSPFQLSERAINVIRLGYNFNRACDAVEVCPRKRPFLWTGCRKISILLHPCQIR